jgi:hypothetical protein
MVSWPARKGSASSVPDGQVWLVSKIREEVEEHNGLGLSDRD